jgi:acyl carrier protein
MTMARVVDKDISSPLGRTGAEHMNGHESRVANAIREVFANKGQRPPELGPHTVLDTSLGLESIDFAELAVRLESEFGKDPFSSGDVPPIRTLADLAALYLA